MRAKAWGSLYWLATLRPMQKDDCPECKILGSGIGRRIYFPSRRSEAISQVEVAFLSQRRPKSLKIWCGIGVCWRSAWGASRWNRWNWERDKESAMGYFSRAQNGCYPVKSLDKLDILFGRFKLWHNAYSGLVQEKTDLTGQLDRCQLGNYFKPCFPTHRRGSERKWVTGCCEAEITNQGHDGTGFRSARPQDIHHWAVIR